MTQFSNLVQSIFVLIALISCALWLKQRSVVGEEHRVLFGRLVTDFVLPALIFSNLARQPVRAAQLITPLLMLASIVICNVLGWILGRALKLSRPVLGSLVLVAGFGSSSTLGYALVNQAYNGDALAMQEALLVGEFGACLPFFTLGVAIAMYFGRSDSDRGSVWSAVSPFFWSPIFVAVVLGLVVSALMPPQNPALQLAHRVLDVVGGSLAVFIALAIGLMLRRIELRTLIWLIGVIAVLKLVVEPLLAGWGAGVLGVPPLEREILVIEAAMPSGAVAAVVGSRYGCDGAVASSLVIATYLLSLVTLPLMFLVTG